VSTASHRQRRRLVSASSVLDERSLLVLQLRYEDGYTQQEIGKVIGVSRQMVCRIIANAMDRLRRHPNIVIDFLDG
jgi:RNA polymerase sigma factor (sigma-70 family)